MPLKAELKQRHEDLLTGILVNAVQRLNEATVGVANYDPTREHIEIENLATDLQSDEKECEGDGTINPNIAVSVIPSFQRALEMLGCDIHPGPNTPPEGYAWKPETVSIGGTVSLRSVYNIGIIGHNLKATLDNLTEPVLRQAAKTVLQNQLRATLRSYEARHH